MQPINLLTQTLRDLADSDHYLFSLNDLSSILPGLGPPAFKALLARAAKKKLLVRICRGIYLYPEVEYPAGLLLFHVASKIRAREFNYISLETALSDAGVISQIPMNWITLMSSGRSYVVDCGKLGHIEFIHTQKFIESIASQLSYDGRCNLWRADISLALQDMKDTRRNMDLIDWEAVDELV